ncbi:hypothetical protein C5167_021297 [Papaver somniferum]|uniref:Uncharacterized protein n=1 Tax=Papaver somniferum TaxID=3469 RepID=A0A4Y7IYQ1_PAPSO|nr:hypothetical protein C5167_021297 [Papaver somniferum]
MASGSSDPAKMVDLTLILGAIGEGIVCLDGSNEDGSERILTENGSITSPNSISLIWDKCQSTWSDQTFLQQKEEFIDLARAYVSHSSIIWCCWFTVVHWVRRPWLPHDRQHFPPTSYTGEYRYDVIYLSWVSIHIYVVFAATEARETVCMSTNPPLCRAAKTMIPSSNCQLVFNPGVSYSITGVLLKSR